MDTSLPEFFDTVRPDSQDASTALLAGIKAAQAAIPPWYLYDVVGSRLFDVITVLPDYYPTRTEASILSENAEDIASAVPVKGGTMIDLGAGDCGKAPQLFDELQPQQYVPVDISTDYLRGVVTRLQQEHPDIEMIGVGADFSRELALPRAVGTKRRVFFFPGSSIGNYDPAEARAFLERMRDQMEPDAALWIGVDLVKDVDVMERAYDDDLGVTQAFNLNLLNNVNRSVGTDFRPRDWKHVARYDADLERIEMHLEARRDLQVTWPEGRRRFAEGERIHTESSYKYTMDSFRELLVSAGLEPVDSWTDARDWFAVFVAAPAA
jgi:dimethylhistidine N-methyltransferase